MIALRNIVLLIILIVITYTDFRRQEIDNGPIILGLVFIVLFSLLGFNDVSIKSSIAGFLLGGIAFTILAFWGMGGGDIKLMAMLGFFLGWKLTILVMFLSFLIGTIFGIFYMIFRKARVKDYMPFGPAIALATVIVLFWGQQIINHCEAFWFLR